MALISTLIASRAAAQSPARSAQLRLTDSVSARVHIGGADTSITAFTPQGVFRLHADSVALAGWAVAAANLPGPAGGTGKPMLYAARLRATDLSGNAMQLARLSADAFGPYQLTVSNGAWGFSEKIPAEAVSKLFAALQGRAGREPVAVTWVLDPADTTKQPGVRPAEAAPDNPRPRYPTHAEFVRADGEVVAQFIVGVDGRARRESLLIVRATSPLFALSVRDALPAMRFVPASRGGEPIDQVVVQTFQFKIP